MAAYHAYDTIDLNDPDSYLQLDPTGIMRMTVDFAAQCREAVSIAQDFTPPDEFLTVKNVVLCGLGMAIAGDLVDQLVVDRISVPFAVNRQYDLPAWTNEETLIILSSYSGNTEETVTGFQQALSRRTKAVCITSGGKVGQLAAEHSIPMITIPGGRPPRASTGYLILPLLLVLEKIGLVPSLAKERDETIALLDSMSARLAPTVPVPGNEAKEIASSLFGKFTLIYGSGFLAPVAYRWQTQFNENGKALAHAGQLPEMNHNEVVAWAHRSPLSDNLAAILLRTPDDEPRIRARFDLTKRIISVYSSARECWSQGKSRMAQQMSLLYLGDFVSIYLAFLSRKDPAEINAINFLKGELAKLPM